ncbi:acyl-CoA N-acyltransferase [Aspergillus leporis]|jgi:RimJ/RimL family protein N-acetyltransferase|uniref:Acyl-CoA N-acyltransferase n=1 Tax=Aspergillus leporis TaxID=41062 RepID=A0A5N5WJ17_9EURO|nr:acyl-CoA N-acyltransferase [Aspergillus leporis]
MEPPPAILHLSNHLIRPFYTGDIEALAEEANNPEIGRWLRNRFPQPYSLEDAKTWVWIANSSLPILNFAICRQEDNVAIGSIGLTAKEDVYYRTMEIGYWLGQDHWGKGIATEALSALTSWAFENFGHVLRLEAEIYDGNEASQKVLLKAGYELEGRRRKAVEKNGVVMDALMFVTFRREG